MNWITIGVGVAAFLYGVYTLIMRVKAPEKFGKLEAMKKFWGEKSGLVVHFVGYTLIPMIVGISFVIAGIKGVTLFGN
jgi:hypothetical protein